MKKSMLFLLPSLVVVILLSAFSGQVAMYPEGAPAGYTGSPGDGQNCTHCHNGSASTVSNWITSDIPASGYLPGQMYNITVTVSGSGTKGFEVSPQNLTGTLLGTLTAGAGNKLVGSGKYVTHSSASNSNPATWTFKWTAPPSGTGPVTFYGAFTVNEPVTKLSTLTVNENLATAIPELGISLFKTYPNPVKDNFMANFSLIEGNNVNISLFDMNGQMIMQLFEGYADRGNHEINFDLGIISPGIYMVKMRAGDQLITRKIIID